MADYFTQFSCLLDLKTQDNLDRALTLYRSFAHEQEENPDIMSMSFNVSQYDDKPIIWIYDDESGNPDQVISYVVLLCKELSLNGLWGFQWANTCSKHRLDGFGGGACVIDLENGSVTVINLSNWLEKNTRR